MMIFGIFIGLLIAVWAMFRGLNGAFAMTAAALCAALIGGVSPIAAVEVSFAGVQSMVPIIMRILAAGVLVGSLMYTGAALRIAESIIEFFGEKHLYGALALAAFILAAVGVFPDVVLIAISPIALAAASRLKKPLFSVLLALSGGVKAGNFASPNPLVLAAAEGYKVPLSTLILVNYVPALCTVALTVLFCNLLKNKKSAGGPPQAVRESTEGLPSFGASIVGPLIAVGLIMLRPITGVAVDPVYAMPIGGLAGILAAKKGGELIPCLNMGMQKVSGVILLMLGVGAFLGVISHSNLKDLALPLADNPAFPLTVLAPLLAVVLVTMTGSATGSATIVAGVIAPLAGGQNALVLASLTCAGTLLFEGALHCSFLHITREAMGMTLRQRLKVLPYEAVLSVAEILLAAGFLALISGVFHLI